MKQNLYIQVHVTVMEPLDQNTQTAEGLTDTETQHLELVESARRKIKDSDGKSDNTKSHREKKIILENNRTHVQM